MILKRQNVSVPKGPFSINGFIVPDVKTLMVQHGLVGRDAELDPFDHRDPTPQQVGPMMSFMRDTVGAGSTARLPVGSEVNWYATTIQVCSCDMQAIAAWRLGSKQSAADAVFVHLQAYLLAKEPRHLFVCYLHDTQTGWSVTDYSFDLVAKRLAQSIADANGVVFRWRKEHGLVECAE